MREPVIAAFDVAGRTGWAMGHGRRLPEVGHWELPNEGEDLGSYFHTFQNNLDHRLDRAKALADECDMDLIVGFEAPVFPKPFIFWPAGPGRGKPQIKQHASIKDRRKLYGLVSILEVTCYRRGIFCTESSTGEVKKALTGNGKAEKDDMVRMAKKMGVNVAVHDEADALAVWLCMVESYAKQHLPALDRLRYRGGLI